MSDKIPLFRTKTWSVPRRGNSKLGGAEQRIAATEQRPLDAEQGINTAHRRGRVEMWRGGGRPGMSVSAPFVWRCLSGSTMAPFPHPAHRTGHADLSHPALGQDLTPSPTTGRAQVGSDGRARSARRGTRVDMSRLGVA